MTWTLENTECSEWFERDRANVRLLTSEDYFEEHGGLEIMCLWDEEVSEFVTDGFKDRRHSWHEALVQYANDHKLKPAY